MRREHRAAPPSTGTAVNAFLADQESPRPSLDNVIFIDGRRIHLTASRRSTIDPVFAGMTDARKLSSQEVRLRARIAAKPMLRREANPAAPFLFRRPGESRDPF